MAEDLKTKTRLIAYYLPQFHPIPENDEHWGKGFTEWTNVAKATPLFKGHYQPFLPSELGYYDLRLSEVRKAQADLAREYGVEGFCYWHYWFAGKRLLEAPLNNVITQGEPDFPFCLCWANHSWTAVWKGDSKKIIAEQTYPGITDYTNHFYELLSAFKDSRYIKVDGKLLFSIFSPKSIPDCKEFIQTWQKLSYKEGLNGFHFVGIGVLENELVDLCLDACTPHSPHYIMNYLPTTWKDKVSQRLFHNNYIETKAKLFKTPRIYNYSTFVKAAIKQKFSKNEYPVALPNWDHSPRTGKRGFVLHGSTPELFGVMLKHCITSIEDRPLDKRIIFLKAWNEWAEGNFLEPDVRFGRGYLEAIKKVNIV